MKNRIKFLTAVILLCLSLGGCSADKALVLPVGTEETGAPAGAPEAEQTAEQGESGAEDALIYVHVCGAVMHPQVVSLPAGSRGCEAVEAAGGFAPDAAEYAVNLAEKLEDGAQLYIPTREEAEADRESAEAAESGLVDINRASLAQLCTLPGIGEARANAIIAYREANDGFDTPEEIMQVPGIKEGAFEKIKDKIIVK